MVPGTLQWRGETVTGVFDHDGMTFRYDEIGNGPALVFCHGLGGDRNQLKDLIGPLDSHQLIVWDSRGHGETEPGCRPEDFTFERFADDLRALLDHVDVERAVVGGISMGAGVGVKFAVDHPSRVRALILARPAWLNEPEPPNLQQVTAVGQLLSQAQPEEALKIFESKYAEQLDAVRRVSPPVADSLRQQFSKPKAAERGERLLRMPASVPIESWEVVAHLSTPTLVIGTDRDPAHPLEFAREWARRLPNAELLQIPSRAESPEEHVKQFRANLQRFLESLEAGMRPC